MRICYLSDNFKPEDIARHFACKISGKDSGYRIFDCDINGFIIREYDLEPEVVLEEIKTACDKWAGNAFGKVEIFDRAKD